MKKLIIGYILGILSCIAVVVIAESINSSEVLYDNSNSSSNKENVQDALDDMYNLIGHIGIGYELLTSTPNNLSNELIGGLYRYQGVQDTNNTIDNYICFGTTNKNTCTGDTDKYMYRIIGINTSGQMKLIKKEALNTAYQWNSVEGADWPNSDMYAGLNGNYFLTNIDYVPNSTWSDRISTTNWYYNSISSCNKSALEMYNSELNSSNVQSAKIGLMYLNDYYFSLPGGKNCCNESCSSSWMELSKNDSSAPNTTFEWTIAHNLYGSNPGWVLWVGNPDNRVSGMSISVRPVFFLRASERIASGNGTITDPYMLS